MEQNFKNYKEKQAYYKDRNKQVSQFFVSKQPLYNQNKIVKGRTYLKPKESDK